MDSTYIFYKLLSIETSILITSSYKYLLNRNQWHFNNLLDTSVLDSTYS